MFDLEDEVYLFENDCNRYTVSIEGKKVRKAIINNSDNLEQVLKEYWQAREFLDFHYESTEEYQEAAEFDRYISRLYSEQN